MQSVELALVSLFNPPKILMYVYRIITCRGLESPYLAGDTIISLGIIKNTGRNCLWDSKTGWLNMCTAFFYPASQTRSYPEVHETICICNPRGSFLLYSFQASPSSPSPNRTSLRFGWEMRFVRKIPTNAWKTEWGSMREEQRFLSSQVVQALDSHRLPGVGRAEGLQGGLFS